MPASSPALASSSSTSKPRVSAQRISMRSTISAQSCASVPPAPGVDADERVARRRTGRGTAAASSSSREPLLDRARAARRPRPAATASSAAISTSASRSSTSRSGLGRSRAAARRARARRTPSRRARRRPRTPARPSAPRARATRSLSEAGSKIVREQLQLVANRREALRRRSVGSLHAVRQRRR